MATTKISTGVLKDGSVTSAKLDTNISIVGDLTVDTNTLFVDSASNNVGIGTNSPNIKTHIYQDSASTIGLRIQNPNTSGSASSAVYFQSHNGTSRIYQLGQTLNIRNESDEVAIWSANSEAMRIDSAGNVGIGTSSPAEKLQINNGRLRFLEGGQRQYNIGIVSGTSDFAITDATFSSERMRIDSSGNVGIGTSSPAAPLDIFNSSAYLIKAVRNLSTDAGIQIGANNSGSFIDTVGVHAFSIQTDGAERMRIDSSGNVGIGTSSPATTLDVAATTPTLRITNTKTTLLQEVVGSIEFFTKDASTNSSRILSSIVCNTETGSSVPEGNLIFKTIEGGAAGQGVPATERMRITSTGNVGIGTTIPSTPLVISKNSPASGTMLILQNTLYGSTDTSGLNSIEFGWGNHNAAKISANKESHNRTGFIITGEVGYNVPIEIAMFTSFGDLHVNGDVIAYSTTISDKRLKDDVQTIDNALDKVSNLRGVSYTWNNGNRKGQKDLGLIAQEVEQVLPELVREKEMPMIDGGTYKTVDYEKIVGVLIEAVKELKAEVELLKSK